jgi:hypothetical protein
MEVENSSGDAKAIFQHVGEEEVFVFRDREAKQKPGGKGNRRAKGLAPRDGWGSSFAKASSYAEASGDKTADKTADRSVVGGRWSVGGGRWSVVGGRKLGDLPMVRR